MQTETIKDRVLSEIEASPQEITFEEVIDRNYFLYHVEKGIEQVESGKTVTHDDAKNQMNKWLE